MKVDKHLVVSLKDKRLLVVLAGQISGTECTLQEVSPSGLYVRLTGLGWIANEAVGHWEVLSEKQGNDA